MREITRPGLVLLIICLVAAICLGAAQSITEEPIKRQRIETNNSAMRKILSEATEFSEIYVNSSEVTSVNEGTANGTTAGYVIGTAPKGYGGSIEILVGINTSGVITGVDIVNHSETPGLGANATSPDFLNQYLSKSSALTVTKISPKDNEIEAITAATITSKAVTNGVNAALEYFNANLKGAN